MEAKYKQWIGCFHVLRKSAAVLSSVIIGDLKNAIASLFHFEKKSLSVSIMP